MQKLFLVDAYALIYRFYYAFLKSPMRTPRGQNVSAIFAFTKFINDLIANQDPDYLGVAFDPKGGTFRNKLYAAYKANRSETPEDIIQSVPVIKDILAAMRIPVLEVAGYEADDVIGTLAIKASLADGFDTYMVTPDKDYGQLIRSNVSIYKPAKGPNDVEIIRIDRICEHYGIADPMQVIDILAIWGDAADNIPGVPGIGEKGASNLVAKFGNIAGVLENLDQLTERQARSITENLEALKLAQTLVTIDLNVPVEFNPEKLRLEEPDAEELFRIYRSLGFRMMVRDLETKYPKLKNLVAAKPSKLSAEKIQPDTANRAVQQSLFDFMGESAVPDASVVSTASVSSAVLTTEESEQVEYIAFSEDDPGESTPKTYEPYRPFQKTLEPDPESLLANITNTPHTYITVTKREEIQTLCRQIAQCKIFCFDTETTSVEPMRAAMVGLSIAIEPGTAYWIPKNNDLLLLLKPLFEDPSIAKIGHNIKFDILIMRIYGIAVHGALFDTMIIHYLLNPEVRHSMNFLSRQLLDYDPIPIENLIGKGVRQLTMDKVSPKVLADYAAEDADVTFQLYQSLLPKLEAKRQDDLYHTIEEPLICVLADMEAQGVKIDVEILSQIQKKLTSELISIEAYINELAGTQNLNVNSPKQLGELLYTKLKITDKPKRTKTKQFKTDEETLQELKHMHPIVEQILEYRGLKKLLSTYVEALPLLINPATGRIHTSFNQAVTATGRLSSTNPNLQNIPIRDENGREIRRAIIAGEKGWKIVAADYSQVELRIMAHLSGDQNMIAAFAAGEDIHTATAAKIYNIPLSEVTKDQRRRAKTANFGIIYGISSFGLAVRLGIPRGEAKELIDNYFIHFPDVKRYMDNASNEARSTGYVSTIFGRRRYLPDINSQNAMTRSLAERNAINAPIQGSAADIMKLGMIGVSDLIRQHKLRSRIILQVHDEIVIEAPENEVEAVSAILKHQMAGAANLSVPLEVEVGVGNNWLEAH